MNPKNILNNNYNKNVFVKLKWGSSYTGIFIGSDNYMNIILDSCSEVITEQNLGFLGLVLIRCNNILFISFNNN
ncbi:small nuclear ribonucleoprotein F (nucleomorph) [Guillardia theta]|uniref:Sm protein F n=1 Tax=Guillardia theta TaxID=55529 RepID=Q98S49_GUITH|nr:small nuclear ribonucleoprotein F [Guillardia theta]AAK39734.1 small nuclear ribonucleoprotein F [Guillardia theta]